MRSPQTPAKQSSAASQADILSIPEGREGTFWVYLAIWNPVGMLPSKLWEIPVSGLSLAICKMGPLIYINSRAPSMR